ncbi:GntR family transcriptional regulator [Enterococcus hulanensis]|uniref:GntR family transcriptional regulator n=1 Tax=Enterococcus hulanensis TaxID=2559929 RepID=A0ABU3F1T8_9ENTE|nr:MULTISPECIES: GntR family transcriptional regulator [Enterococcus]MBO0411285.1 GntR family transcriptional regulator [Enterococcus hulanensis]MBO0456912.1 GntR family transcriptional regulator [Enterococcus hulanensis]MDT2601104.1 GntR family transcriptional regulator [Enterococcus hulanensis]MDT2610414.1 GntR family transcriptional regulator [Enterococcus hulanensis]MDT2617141.1 GntR family transcriptional regulator [Enterococcus hulanensis]
MDSLNLYNQIAEKLKKNILDDQYPSGKLPNERELSETFKVSRSTMKKAMDSLVEDGLLFRKARSGTFINLLFKKNYDDYSHQKRGPIGLTKSFSEQGKEISSMILLFEVILPPEEVRKALLLTENDFTYHFKRVRYIDKVAVSIETNYIPIQLFPQLTKDIAKDSIYDYAITEMGISLTNSYVSIFAAPSNEEDQKELQLTPCEPVTVTEEIVFTDTGIPFEYTIVRNHYKKFTYNTSVSSLK